MTSAALRQKLGPLRLDHLLLACSIILIVFSAILSQRNALDLRESQGEIQRLNRVITDNELVLSSLKDLETGQRGYLLTGDRTYLAPFDQAGRDLPPRVESLRKDVVDSGQQARVQRLMVLIAEKKAEVEATLLVRDQLGADAALAIVRTDKGRESMDAIRAVCEAISSEGHRALLVNSTALAERQKRASLMALAITVALFLFLAIASLAIQGGVRQRDRLITELDSARRQFETTLLSIGDGVVATDAKGVITFINHAARQVSGRNEQEALASGATFFFTLPIRQ